MNNFFNELNKNASCIIHTHIYIYWIRQIYIEIGKLENWKMGKWGNGKIDQAKRHLWKRKRKRHAFYSMVFDPAHLDSIYRWSRCPTYFFPLPLSLSFSLSLSLFSLWFSSSNRTESNSIFDNVTVHFLAMSKSIQSQLFGII